MKLSEVKNNDEVVITKVLGHGSFRKRITEMGFVKGKIVKVIKTTMFNGPIEFKILNYNITLRKSEAELIEVLPIEELDNISISDFGGVIDRATPEDLKPGNNKTINVALVGNPNSGKTTLYNYISGEREKVGNYSGVTVEIKKTTFKLKGYTFNIYDLPGTYSLTAYSAEEICVRKFIYEETPDIVINVVDASNLERNLFLTTQLIDMDLRVVVALNMFDEVKKQNLELDYLSISRLLGIPFVPTISSKGTGMDDLLSKVIRVYEGKEEVVRHIHINYGAELELSIARIRSKIKENKPITDKISSRFLAIKVLEKDKHVVELLSGYENFKEIRETYDKEIKRIEALENEDSESAITDAKYSFISGALKETYKHQPGSPQTRSDKIDKVMTHPIWGFPIFIIMLFIVFFTTFKMGALPMNWIDKGIVLLGNLTTQLLGNGMLKDLIVDGIISGTGSVLVFLPNILILFFFISLLEGSGYMARAAFIMDKTMHRFGLHGRSFIPLVIGFGCNVPAIMATRTLRNKSDRILTMLIIPFMSCSARLPVYILIISAFFKKYQAIYLLGIYLSGIVIAFITARILNSTLFRNKETPFVMELPAYRMPTFRNILYHMWDKSSQYLRKIGSVILIGVIIIWALEYFPRTTQNTKSYQNQIVQISDDNSISPEIKGIRINEVHKVMDSDRLLNSYLGRIGKFMEPAMQPLGFDWRMSVSLLAGLPAKEIIIGTLGILYQPDTDLSLHIKNNLKHEINISSMTVKNKTFGIPSALAFIIFVLIYFPCIGVVATIKNESGHWGWALFTVIYTTVLAWLAALLVYQVASLLV